MPQPSTSRSRAESFLETTSGFLGVEDFANIGVNRVTIRELVLQGRIVNPAWGIYARSDIFEGMSVHAEWALVAHKYPRAVFCLLSAAGFHGITQENHGRLTVFMPRSYGDKPKMGGSFTTEFEPLVTRTEANLAVGVVEYDIDGVPVRVTSPERTLVDMFRFSPEGGEGRDQVSTEMFFETLRHMTSQDTLFDFDQVAMHAMELGCYDEIRKYTMTSRYHAQSIEP